MKAFKAGVYLLFDKGEVVYVGQSKNPMYRIGSHVQEGKKRFDEYMVFETDEYDAIEAFLISALRPKYNMDYPSTKAMRGSSANVLNHIVAALKQRDEKISAKQKRKKDEVLSLKKENEYLKERIRKDEQRRAEDEEHSKTKTGAAEIKRAKLKELMKEIDLGTVSKVYHEYAREIYAG